MTEADDAMQLINQPYEEILNENHDIIHPPIGIMLEVPSAIYQSCALAKRVDFLSVGSNDLTQYLLAVDRNNARVASLYDGLNPAVLHTLDLAVKAAHQFNKPISICGELASDPVAATILLGMGFDALSMNSATIPRIKWVVRNFTLRKAKELLTAVLKMDNAKQIRHHLEQALSDQGLSSLLSDGKIQTK